MDEYVTTIPNTIFHADTRIGQETGNEWNDGGER